MYWSVIEYCHAAFCTDDVAATQAEPDRMSLLCPETVKVLFIIFYLNITELFVLNLAVFM